MPLQANAQPTTSPPPAVSVIITVLNEGAAIHRLLDSLCLQSRPPDEVVIVDGGSTDNTLTAIRQYETRLPLRLLIEPGANISRGRNLAIAAAAGPIIASTDAGVRLTRTWLAELTAPFTQPQPPLVVSGFFLPDPLTTFEVALGATTLPLLGDIDPAHFLPSSRSIAFSKAAWSAVGGYPEWLDFCEDLIFDFNLAAYVAQEQAGRYFDFAPQAIAYFRPRGTLKAFFKQYYQYARGDGKADLWRKRHAIRYATYLLGGPLLLWLTLRQHQAWGLVGVVLGYVGLLKTPYRRLRQSWGPLSPLEKLAVAALVPAIRVVGDVAKMLGYPVGWAWRLKHQKDNPALHWRQGA
jgi:glycosyltransferase involved in cell wall biosynthesis